MAEARPYTAWLASTADHAFSAVAWGCGAVGVLLPASVVAFLLAGGARVLSWRFLVDRPRGFPLGSRGGIGPAIECSLALVGLGLAIALPLALGGSLWLAEAAPDFEVTDLHVHYGGVPILRGVSLRVAERSICAVLGPSGCGKSTLLRVLNRTLELVPDAKVQGGRASFRGEDLHAAGSDPAPLRKRVGLIPQRPTAFPMSIAENVLFGVRFHGRHGRRRTASRPTPTSTPRAARRST